MGRALTGSLGESVPPSLETMTVFKANTFILLVTLFRESYSFNFEYRIKYFSLLKEHSCTPCLWRRFIKSKMALELKLYALIKNQYTLRTIRSLVWPDKRVPSPPPYPQQGPKGKNQLSSPFVIGEGTSKEPTKRAGKSL